MTILARGLGHAYAFFGASNATRTLPSMRGMVSDLPWSPISISQAVHLGAATSWWAISRRDGNHRAHFVAFAEEPQDLVLGEPDSLLPQWRAGT